MSDKIAFDGDYTDLKFIKSRKVAVISVEIPIERAQAFVEAFGAPNPATGVPVALARMANAPVKEKPKRSWDEMPRSQQAALKCNDPDFRRFLSAEYKRWIGDAVHAAMVVRQFCDVTSRTEFDTSGRAADAWDRIYSNFQMWQRGAAA